MVIFGSSESIKIICILLLFVVVVELASEEIELLPGDFCGVLSKRLFNDFWKIGWAESLDKI